MNNCKIKPCYPHPLQSRAFTLAEVLITLVIIGVIAALTIPTVINQTQKRECVAGLKKAYSLLSTATNAIIAEKGTPKRSYGGWGSINEAAALYKKHLSVAKDCGQGKNYDCFEQGSPKRLGGGNWSNSNWGMFGGSPYKMILSNGMQLVLADTVNDCVYSEWSDSGIKNFCQLVVMDVNGAKGPNTFGRDIYLFAIKEDGFYPGGYDVEGKCTPSSSGAACASRVLREGAINY